MFTFSVLDNKIASHSPFLYILPQTDESVVEHPSLKHNKEIYNPLAEDVRGLFCLRNN
jgi:hypothetical protein